MSTFKPNQTRNNFNILIKLEEFFNGKLGTWKTALVQMELKDDVTPVCS